ncbi:MAG: cyanophycinase [Clostridia bacterium]|nr:cyanophycinase [Clostridia bacterium]
MNGTLMICGGGLTASQDEVFSEFIERAGGAEKARIAFIVTASGEAPDELFRSYRSDMVRLGLPEEKCILVPIYAMHILDERGYNAMTGDAEGLCESLDGVSGVWFSGGDQYYTHQCLLRSNGSDTALLTRIREIYENGGVIGGSSAGAAIMSRVMIGGGNNRGILAHPVVFGYDGYDEMCAKDDPCDPMILARGLGFFQEGIVDQHFNRRPRLLRLVEACLRNNEGYRVGYAVSEDTALVYQNGRITVLGSAGVYVVDCNKAERRAAGNYRGAVLYALHRGDRFDCASLEAELAKAAPQQDGEPSQDYVLGGMINDHGFDDMMEKRLIRANESAMPKNADGFPCVRGAALHDIHGEVWLVIPEYVRFANTRGYRSEHASFSKVGLNIHAEKRSFE